MFDRLSIVEFSVLAQQHKRVAVYQEIPGDQLTPISAYLALNQHHNDLALLESNPNNDQSSRYSHLCFAAIAAIKSYDGAVFVQQDGQEQVLQAEPFTVLRQHLTKFAVKTSHPHCVGGMLGFISYDAVRRFENIADRHTNSDELPDMLFKFYHKNITFDHQSGKIIISVVATIGDDIQAAYDSAMVEIEQIQQQLQCTSHSQGDNLAHVAAHEIMVDIDDAQYRSMVAKAKQRIIDGDIFQVVLSRKFSVKTAADPFDIYRALRFSNPSPYMFYLADDDFAIAGASPEKLVSVKDRVMESCPLAGTVANSGDHKAMASALLQDTKENAEHMMLVDLARNDLGCVAESGSVQVTKLRQVEQYSHVSHISSTVTGVLREDCDALDALQASFPAGTLSGAPKNSSDEHY